MRNFKILIFLFLFSSTIFAQKPPPVKKPAVSAKTPVSVKPAVVGNEKDELEKAVNRTNPAERISALQNFVSNFPASTEKNRVLEMIVVARAQIADEKLRAGDAAGGIEIFKLAVRDAPKPISDKFFTDIVLQIPNNLFFRGQFVAAAEAAAQIEVKIEGNAKQLLGLATFYLGVENADEAKRLAEKAVAVAPDLPAAYQTLGIANRLNFNLEEAANAYSKALELDANSTVSKRSLAEMKRALGKSAEAVALYRELSEKDAMDATAKNGLILSLFDAGNQPEAETEMAKSLEQNPNNLLLLTGAAYWYAANNNAAKTIEFARKAVAVEPRYVWSYIALSRGFLRENRFLDAERALLTARGYGNFPTLDYELATVRLSAGFYREAARELVKTFSLKDDSITVKLGGRVEKQAKTFVELLAPERRASIYEPLAADNIENAQKLKNLLDFYQKLDAPDTTDAEISDATDKFVGGADKMKIHRQLFAANRLLEKKKILPKVAELMKSAVGAVDEGLNVPNAASAVLADQLFESRSLAISKNELVIVPEVPRLTLSNILRGRIEETGGWALYQDNKPAEASVKLKRAVSILPEKSAWWRSSMWRLGAALQADEKPDAALDAYIKGYTNDAPSAAKRVVIETLYSRIHGSLDGLDALIGAKPAAENAAILTLQPEKATTDLQTATKQTAEIEAAPKTESTPKTETESKPSPSPEIELPPRPQPITEATPDKTESTPIAKLPDTETKTEVKPAAENAKTPVETKVSNTPKPLFEPVIITIPGNSNPKKPKIDAPAKEEKSNDDDTSKAGDKPIDSAAPEKNVDVAATRTRLVTGAKTETEDARKCVIIVSQESVSLLNSGGNLGVLVGFENDADDYREITASSSSPSDVETVLEPEIGAASRRAFFIVKSVSAKTGIFTVTFESPCGKREIIVKVR